MDVWSWLSTIPAGGVLSGVGVGAFVTAILTDRLFTRGQHLRRVADLNEHHARELAEKDARIADIRESRDGYKEAARIERERADKATDSVGEMSEAVESVLHVLQSLDRALPSPREGGA